MTVVLNGFKLIETVYRDKGARSKQGKTEKDTVNNSSSAEEFTSHEYNSGLRNNHRIQFKSL